MKNLFAVIALVLAVGAIYGCAEKSMVQANETPGPTLQSPYCVQHAYEARCMNP